MQILELAAFPGIGDGLHCLTLYIVKVIVRLELLLFIMEEIPRKERKYGIIYENWL